MRGAGDISEILSRIDGRSYRSYREIAGVHDLGDLTLCVDHVQADPFAAPSKVRVRVEQSRAGFPADLFANPVRRTALEDLIARQVARAIGTVARASRGTGHSGEISIDAGGQEVLARTAVVVQRDWVEARLYVGLPAAGRRVLGRQADAMLTRDLPRIAESALLWDALPRERIRAQVECVENQEHVRGQLESLGLIAFVADGSILPRASGASDRPLDRAQAVPFVAPDSLRVSVALLNPIQGDSGLVEQLSGLGLPQGVTLIVGGGYHGKSTLLDALERGVYPHIVGDGREQVVTRPDAVKVSAEDGRRVEAVDISSFISNLPLQRDTTAFRSDDASGSTSQAAGILEALEVGSKLLLLDEDTSATNFMVRDARMQSLVQKQSEPITPFVDRVRELYDEHGVSTVMVMGGCGDYFDVADTVIMLREYLPHEVTAEARQVASDHPTGRRCEAPTPFSAPRPRVPQAASFDASRGRREVKVNARALDRIQFGSHDIELRGVEQLVDLSQTRAVGHAIWLARERFMDGERSLRDVVDAVDQLLQAESLDLLDPYHRTGRHPGSFARPRTYEIAAAINRLRTLRMRQKR